jgi:hypothetical protein
VTTPFNVGSDKDIGIGESRSGLHDEGVKLKMKI